MRCSCIVACGSDCNESFIVYLVPRIGLTKHASPGLVLHTSIFRPQNALMCPVCFLEYWSIVLLTHGVIADRFDEDADVRKFKCGGKKVNIVAWRNDPRHRFPWSTVIFYRCINSEIWGLRRGINGDLSSEMGRTLDWLIFGNIMGNLSASIFRVPVVQYYLWPDDGGGKLPKHPSSFSGYYSRA